MISESKITFYTHVMGESLIWLTADVRNVQFYRLVLMFPFEAQLDKAFVGFVTNWDIWSSLIKKKYLLVMWQTGILKLTHKLGHLKLTCITNICWLCEQFMAFQRIFSGCLPFKAMGTIHPVTQCHIPQDVNPQPHHCENCKCQTIPRCQKCKVKISVRQSLQIHISYSNL